MSKTGHSRWSKEGGANGKTGRRAFPPESETQTAAAPLFQRVFPVGYGVPEDAFDRSAAGADTDPESYEGNTAIALDPYRRAVDIPQPSEVARVREVQDFEALVASRLGFLNRQLSDIREASIRRGFEDRKETWILIAALSVVLVFCFAALYMNQVEVRDLNHDFQEEMRQQSDYTVSRFQSSLERLSSKNLPEVQAALKRAILDAGYQQRLCLDEIETKVELLGERNDDQMDDTLRLLEDHVARIEEISENLEELQMAFLARDSKGIPASHRENVGPPRRAPKK